MIYRIYYNSIVIVGFHGFPSLEQLELNDQGLFAFQHEGIKLFKAFPF